VADPLTDESLPQNEELIAAVVSLLFLFSSFISHATVFFIEPLLMLQIFFFSPKCTCHILMHMSSE
jgi:hypothetical protein